MYTLDHFKLRVFFWPSESCWRWPNSLYFLVCHSVTSHWISGYYTPIRRRYSGLPDKLNYLNISSEITELEHGETFGWKSPRTWPNSVPNSDWTRKQSLKSIQFALRGWVKPTPRHCRYILFSKAPPPEPLYIGGKEILHISENSTEKSFKKVGLHLDQHLSFQHHHTSVKKGKRLRVILQEIRDCGVLSWQPA